MKERPDEANIRSSLGMVYASLGLEEEAIHEGKLAVELYPVSKDLFIGGNRTLSRPFREMAAMRDFRGQIDAGHELGRNSLSPPVPWSPLESSPVVEE